MMHQQGQRLGWLRGLGVAGALALAIASPVKALAQIQPDQTLGPESSQVIPDHQVRGNPAIQIMGGAARGNSLFHSFSDFNVGVAERVYFSNPTGIEHIFSRVTGKTASQILGTLGVEGLANLFLLNPNGILFGPDAQLDLNGSFAASTADQVVVDPVTFSAAQPQALPLLTLNVRPGLQYGVNPQGNIDQAAALRVAPGQNLTLQGQRVSQTGSLTAPGGQITILGDRIALADRATLDASSPNGGGTVLVGGAGQGQTVLPTARRTWIGPNATIRADALTVGEGGEVVLWADEVTGFYGEISAQGGPQAGNGGRIEVSGRDTLLFRGRANTVAPAGTWGTLLLDPVNITIANGTGESAADGNQTFAGNNSGLAGAILDGPLSAIADTAPTTIFESELEGLAGNTNVQLQATNDITVNDLADDELRFAAGSGAIAFSADADRDGSGSILMTSGDRITTQGRSITMTGTNLRLGTVNTVGSANSGNITLDAAGDLRADSLVTFSINAGSGGSVRLNAGDNLAVNQVSTFSIDAPNQGNGGAIALTAQRGAITTGKLESFSINAGDDSNGGAVQLDALGDITIRDELVAFSINAGNGGSVRLNAGGNIAVDQVSTFSIDAPNQGNGGAIALTAQGGEITTGKLESFSINAGDDGNAGAIELDTPGNITVNDELAAFSIGADDNGLGGLIRLNSGGNIAIADKITTFSIDAGETGNGGPVDLTAMGDITLAVVETFSNGSGQDGRGGAIRLNADGDIQVDLSETTSLTSLPSGENDAEIDVNLTAFNASASGADGDSIGGDIQLTSGGDTNISVRSDASIDLDVNSFDDVEVEVRLTAFNGSANGGDRDNRGGTVTLDVGGDLNLILDSQLAADIRAGSFDDIKVEELRLVGFDVTATGGDRDNIGGTLALTAQGDINVLLNNQIELVVAEGSFDQVRIEGQELTALSASTNNADRFSQAGTIRLDAGQDIIVRLPNTILLSGIPIDDQLSIEIETSAFRAAANGSEDDAQGGTVELTAGRDIQIEADEIDITANGIAISRDNEVAKLETRTIALNVASDENRAKPGQDSIAGNITLQAERDIFVDSETWALADEAGADSFGGDITFTAGRNLVARNRLRTEAEDADQQGIGGDVQLTAGNDLHAGSITTRSEEAQEGGSGGNVTLIAGNRLTTKDIDSSAIADVEPGQGNIGNGGAVTLISLAGLIDLQDITINANALGDGDSGDIRIMAPDIQLINTELATTASIGGGNAGDIFLQADNTAQLNNSRLVTFVGPGATGEGGDITVIADQIKLENFSLLDTATFDAGNAGDVLLQGRAIALDRSNIFSTAFGAGNSGTITLDATEAIALTNRSVVSTATSAITPNRGGNVVVNTGTLSLTDGSQLQALTQGNGQAGSIVVNARDGVFLDGIARNSTSLVPRDTVLISDPISTPKQEPNNDQSTAMPLQDALFRQDGATTNPNVEFSTRIPYVSIQSPESDNPSFDYYAFEVTAGTRAIFDVDTNSRTDNLNLHLALFDASGGLLATSDDAPAFEGGEGSIPKGGPSTFAESYDPYFRYVFNRPGTYFIRVGKTVVRDFDTTLIREVDVAYDLQVSLFSSDVAGQGASGFASGLFAQSENVGAAGDIAVNTPQLTVQNAAQILASSTSEGPGGSVAIATDQMQVTDGSRITVSSPESRAGDLTVNARSLFLNRGELSAVTGRSDAAGGANIRLQDLRFLVLTNESLISASALGDADGGNVAIDADFILALQPLGPDGSDIVANAVRGNGGRVDITTQSLIGVEFRPQRTPQNDITVSSEFGLSGVFVQNDPGIDPSQGLTALPTNLGDPTGLIDRRCALATGSTASEFVVTGRGGLPPDPSERLDEAGMLADLGPSQIQPTSDSSTQHSAHPPSSESAAAIAEAQGWQVNAAGQIQLVAAVPQADVSPALSTSCAPGSSP